MLLAQGQPVEVLVTTTGTPIWLTIATLAVSGLALFISGLQYLTHRSETSRVRPNIAMSAIFADNFVTSNGTQQAIGVSFRNRGREATRLVDLWVSGETILLNGLQPKNIIDTFNVDAEAMEKASGGGLVIEGFSTLGLHIDGSNIEGDYVRITAAFGHGMTLEKEVTRNQAPRIKPGKLLFGDRR